MLKIGHRGAMGYAPENTFKSFEKAVSLEADMIEFDVRKCKSGELVVIHDHTIDRTSNGRGYVSDMTLRELRTYDFGEGECLPLPEEVINRFISRIKLNIEIKDPAATEDVCTLISRTVAAGKAGYHDFIVSCFDHYELLKCRALNAEIRTGALISGIPVGYAEFAQKARAYSVHPDAEFVTPEFIQDARSRGLPLYVWTVNELSAIQEMQDMGVDGIISNYPDRLKILANL